MPKKTTQKRLAPPVEAEGSSENEADESEDSTPSSSDDATESIDNPDDNDTTSDEESDEDDDEPAEKPKPKDKEKKPRKPVDALVLDYAETLKAQLGKDYDKELDSLPLRARISAMKVLVKIKNKPPAITEGHPPKGGTTTPKPVRVGGYNFKELGQKY